MEETLAPKKILVVDDEPFIQRSLRMNLEMEGYQVDTASDGLEALRAVTDNPPDLILLDIMMPHMDGYEFARKLRENPQWDRIYVIALTARGQERDKTRSAQIGIDEHVSKPFHPAKLIERIKTILQTKPSSPHGA